MAADGVFFRAVGAVHPVTQVPVAAIILQGAVAALIALSGRYDQILSYVVAIDWVFFGLTAAALIVIRGRDRHDDPHGTGAEFRVPGHPLTTLVFVAVSWLVVANTVHRFPREAGMGVLLLLLGVPVFYMWRRRSRIPARPAN
jgi:APA family basic amino acid/polyamine antiporter